MGGRPRTVPSYGGCSGGSQRIDGLRSVAATSYADEIERTEVPAAGDLMRLRQRFHLTMLIGWLVAIGLGWVLWLILDLSLDDVAGTFAGVDAGTRDPAVIGVLLLTLIALIRYHAGWSRFQRRIDVTQARLGAGGALFPPCASGGHSPAVAASAGGGLDGLLSKAIHKPWHVPGRVDGDVRAYEVARGALPFAVQIATIQDDDRNATARDPRGDDRPAHRPRLAPCRVRSSHRRDRPRAGCTVALLRHRCARRGPAALFQRHPQHAHALPRRR